MDSSLIKALVVIGAMESIDFPQPPNISSFSFPSQCTSCILILFSTLTYMYSKRGRFWMRVSPNMVSPWNDTKLG